MDNRHFQTDAPRPSERRSRSDLFFHPQPTNMLYKGVAHTDYIQSQFNFHDNAKPLVKKSIDAMQTLDRRFYVQDFTTKARMKAMLQHRLKIAKTMSKHERVRKCPLESAKLVLIEGSLKDC